MLIESIIGYSELKVYFLIIRLLSMWLIIVRLVKEYDISFVSTGDVLRKEIAAKSEVGRKAEAIVASGGMSWETLS